MTNCEKILEAVPDLVDPVGFEAHPFKIGWYNEAVAHSCFKLPYPADTLAFIVISTPRMFDKAFKPFISRTDCTGPQDAIDTCMTYHFDLVKQRFPQCSIEAIHDFELLPNRRPKILVQTAGHVAGAVRFYQRADLANDPWDQSKKIYGVCIHPKYGGWFALRGVLVFKDVLCPQLKKKLCEDLLPSDEQKRDLLEKYNDHWQDWSFRDVLPVEDRYSEEQKTYFATPPGERQELVRKIKNS
ncbi:cyanocobalamin reductase / alkylcobalamin dealkylase-like [Liolophura sinensis]|uniref:cyanocobalamin reductase / alkylcobalamin dealkylase-like n=1 Tax=Liolophura sinensis TaxID=3198878 RepID=UPI0031593720